MGLWQKITGREKRSGSVTIATPFGMSASLDNNPMRLSTVYRCVDVISDSVAALPLMLYQCYDNGGKYRRYSDPMARLLNEAPDDRMTRFSFFKGIVSSMLLHGNGYAWIDRSHTPAQLVFLHPSKVVPIVRTANGVDYIESYQVVGFPKRIEPRDMVHVLNYSDNGIVGVSTIAHASNTLFIARGGESQAAEYYNGSGQPNGILSVHDGRLSRDQKDSIYKAWSNRMRNSRGGMVVLEGNMSYQGIAMNPADAQLLESRQYSVVDICRFFGVSPVKCFDLSKSSYSTVEATQLSFLTDTLQPILEKIELEIQRKYFMPSQGWWEVRFDTSELLRADKNAQANYYRTMANIGVMTPNEIRASIGMEPIEGGDSAYVQTNMTTLEAVAKPSNDE